MEKNIEIKYLDNSFTQKILGLILPIQQIEFNVPVTLDGQPDLLDIEKFYIKDCGNFWGAEYGQELVGTIALIDIGHNSGAIRKMFVKSEYRGSNYGIASLLLKTLIDHCYKKGIDHLYLGTVDMLRAAHRFYEKNGFVRLNSEDLPAYFPRMMGENVYYELSLSDLTQ